MDFGGEKHKTLCILNVKLDKFKLLFRMLQAKIVYPSKKSVTLRCMATSSYWPPFQKKFNKHYSNRPTEHERHKHRKN